MIRNLLKYTNYNNLIHRDKNASLNIFDIAFEYINYKKRPEYLMRGQMEDL
jgi:hypothetical protein